MVNINNRGTEVIIDENEIDKISDLPIDILNEIFKDMSFRELVKLYILSKKWKHFWAMHPILVLDGEFFKEITGNIGLTKDGFSVLVDNILFRHVGSIVKFFLDLSTICYTDDRDLGHWLLCVFNILSERSVGEVTHYLEDPNCVVKQFEKLEFVELRKFEGTQFELYFVKKILAYSPSLSRMIVEPSDDIDVAEVLRLYEELMMSLKASPRVKVIVTPHGQVA
ncbi:F-box/FBD/LRR-repeat protein At1g13570 [Solanum verrucosum]|uniref:F-box/FBD/LRR-repeat protein At1g13570 n=1 Tax=Solanum verrucosum TaxID=315347 RepID=UPI0020D068AC|nr:F-box/FBD/LRR-repeat protein At1g13570 [Solanum verrucosum]